MAHTANNITPEAKQRGLFIVVEGIEGVGKTTNMRFIEQWWQAQSVEVIATREPGGTPLAENIRGILLENHAEKVSDTTELLLMFAARAQHIATLIRPNLLAGRLVLSDRFTDATYAYQGGGRGVRLDKIVQLENIVQGALRPDLVIILDVPVAVSQARVNTRQADLGEAKDRIEKEKTAFFERVRAAYLARAEQNPEDYVVIDASQSLETVQVNIAAALTVIAQKWRSGALPTAQAQGMVNT